MPATSAGPRAADLLRPSKSLVSGAYEAITRQVLNNAFEPGFQILERDLAEQLGMSRTPVHEALIGGVCGGAESYAKATGAR